MNIHGNCVLLGDAGAAMRVPWNTGVLLLGGSGSGKSDFSLRLIERGAILVSDDRTELRLDQGRLMAQAPPALTGLLEVFGLGILRLWHAAQAEIVMVAKLDRGPLERLPEREFYEPPHELGLPPDMNIPLIRLDPCEPSAPAKLLAAAFGLTKDGFRDDLNAARFTIAKVDK